VTGARSLLFLAGQVPYAAAGGVDQPGDSLAQARNVFGAIKAQRRPSSRSPRSRTPTT
jgi:enamine deaminase RidA (YjgF/YER057c/UK114 family)